MAKKLSKYQKRLFRLILDGVLSTLALLFCVLSASYFLVDQGTPYYFPAACFFMVCIYLSRFFLAKEPLKNNIRSIGLAVFYLAMGVVSCFAGINIMVLQVVSMLFAVSIVFDGVISLVIRHRARNIFINVLKFTFATLLIIVYLFLGADDPTEAVLAFAFLPLFMAAIAFAHAMIMVFSGIRKTTLIEIIRKTYSIEILYGLVVLIVATSLVLCIIEDMTFGDALWYCFAIVTTIGFGDITATTIVGRILSVILGVYGIVVVALITSIIVNFYNETKGERNEGEENLKEEIKNLEEQRKTEDNEETKE